MYRVSSKKLLKIENTRSNQLEPEFSFSFDRQIRVSVESWEMYVKIDIADTGIGISEQHQGAIFKRFYREDIVHDVDGIGIGLYLAREIVTLQGGYIRVTSEVGRGSTFSVFLPRQ